MGFQIGGAVPPPLGTVATLVALGFSPLAPADEPAILPTRIAFGSCAHQDKPHPVLETVVTSKPDLFVYLGDNIYGDTRDMAVLQAKYGLLGAKPEFQKLRAACEVLAVWDDHDYGENDAGKEYPKKVESERIFLDFWKVPAESPRRTRPGIYGVRTYTGNGRTLQLLLLDTRYFRDPLARNPKEPVPPYKNAYRPDPDPAKSLLGADQWTWLEKQLSQPADLRIIATSIQFGHEYNGWESWTNFPHEQQRFLDLIRKTRASGIVFISGDVHWGEISVRHPEGLYPIHDITASGITQDWHNTEPNKFRHGDPVRENHFGLIEVDWSPADPSVTLQIIDKPGKVRLSKTVRLSEISFAEKQ